MSQTAPVTIGCFEVELLEPCSGSPRCRWRARNTLTLQTHVAYGTEDELREQLTRQSKSWEARFERQAATAKKPGAAWRRVMTDELKKAYDAKKRKDQEEKTQSRPERHI